MGKRLKDKHIELLNDPEYQEAYKALESEFLIAKVLIEARTSANLTQKQVADRMGRPNPLLPGWSRATPYPVSKASSNMQPL